jgi:gluconolactonase
MGGTGRGGKCSAWVIGCGMIWGQIWGSPTASAAELTDLLAPNATATKVVGDCKFTEGPAFSPLGDLLFSDIPNSRIVRVDAAGQVSDYLKPSGQANGIVFDQAGHAYVCQGGARRVVRIGGVDGKVEVLADQFNGLPLNSPNDLALDGQGGLYFTDPRYGNADDVQQPCMGVYYVSPLGRVTRVIESLQRPNGILVTTDGKTLLVAEPNRRELWSFSITEPGSLSEGRVIFTGDEALDGGGPDGMALDADGRIYATYKSLVVLNADGSLVGRIPVPEQPSNCKFGGPNGNTLYVTARTSLYSVAMAVSGAPLATRGPRPMPQVGWQVDGVRVRAVADEAAATKSVKFGDITLNVPENWEEQAPSSNLRLGQMKVPPSKDDKDPSELSVFFFQGDGGGIDANLKRWNDQFETKGREIKLFQGKCEQGAYYLSEVSGTYLKSIGPPIAGRKQPMPGYSSLNLILQVEGQGNYFVRLIGPAKSIAEQSKAFRSSFGGDAGKEEKYELK